MLGVHASPAHAQTPGAPRDIVLRSLCPNEADRRCQVPLFDPGGRRIGMMDVDNQTGLQARDIGNDLLEVQLQGRTVLIGRLGVIVSRQRATTSRQIDCERVAGVRGADCLK